ncbi:MAG: DNA alkylation repair protein [Pseudobutyrivibrio sp.]|nr:DNA alkylation repair protein [Pseudobutyrivibrio sp.]
MGVREDIKEELLKLQDIEYRDFQSKLIPTVGVEYFIGVRTPDLRKLAKTLAKRDDIDEFLSQVPHDYFDENQLHAFILSEMKDYENCVEKLQRFLPYVNNWATCDQMSPKVFKKHKQELLPLIDKWLASGETYSIRFGIKMLMEHFLDDDFDLSYPEKVAAVRSEEYYVNMMIAWYFATALAKQYDAIIPFIENKKLDQWCHNKAIQKSIESNRITPEQKEYLRSLKIR